MFGWPEARGAVLSSLYATTALAAFYIAREGNQKESRERFLAEWQRLLYQSTAVVKREHAASVFHLVAQLFYHLNQQAMPQLHRTEVETITAQIIELKRQAAALNVAPAEFDGDAPLVLVQEKQHRLEQQQREYSCAQAVGVRLCSANEEFIFVSDSPGRRQLDHAFVNQCCELTLETSVQVC